MKKWWIAAGVAAAPFVIASPAWGAVSATASLSNFAWQLFDLDPTDGITPAITFAGESSVSTSSLGSSSDYRWAPGFFASTAASSTSGLSSAGASTGASGGSATISLRSPTAGTWVYASADGSPVNASFTITPWTAVLFTADASGTAKTTIGFDGVDREYANASVSMTAYLSPGIDSQEYHSAYRSAYASDSWDGSGYTGQTVSFAGLLRLGFGNFSGEAVNGLVYASASASGGTSLPVPEPHTYALMLAGLATVGLWVRRRRRDG